MARSWLCKVFPRRAERAIDAAIMEWPKGANMQAGEETYGRVRDRAGLSPLWIFLIETIVKLLLEYWKNRNVNKIYGAQAELEQG